MTLSYIDPNHKKYLPALLDDGIHEDVRPHNVKRPKFHNKLYTVYHLPNKVRVTNLRV